MSLPWPDPSGEPPIEIGDVLNRRTDLSTFLVHLTRDGDRPAKDNLLSILSTGTIEARTALGWRGFGASALTDAERACMKVVCFSETPLEYVHSLYGAITGREVELKPYGLAFTKMTARYKGAGPVWYVNMSPYHDWVVVPALNKLCEEAKAHPEGIEASPAAKILPFVEGMGTWPGGRKEFWWEREWRFLGNFSFARDQIALVLAPEADHTEFETLGYENVIDPKWSLERMIAKLVGLPGHLTSVF